MYSYPAQTTIQLGALLAVNICIMIMTSLEHPVDKDVMMVSSYAVMLTLGLILIINSGNTGTREWMDKNVISIFYFNLVLSYYSFNLYLIDKLEFDFYWCALLLITNTITLISLLLVTKKPK